MHTTLDMAYQSCVTEFTMGSTEKVGCCITGTALIHCSCNVSLTCTHEKLLQLTATELGVPAGDLTPTCPLALDPVFLALALPGVLTAHP